MSNDDFALLICLFGTMIYIFGLIIGFINHNKEKED
jgi:hypothetical protein